jgi:Mg/Co/Ni transporter MgtE
MNEKTITVCDDDDIDSLAEIIEKYDLLAIPVVNQEKKMEGVVVIDDIVTDLVKKVKPRI